MTIVELKNGWTVRPYEGGLDVYDEDELLCEMGGSFLSDYLDEWGNIDEDELEDAIRDEIDTNRIIDKLAEIRQMEGW